MNWRISAVMNLKTATHRLSWTALLCILAAMSIACQSASCRRLPAVNFLVGRSMSSLQRTRTCCSSAGACSSRMHCVVSAKVAKVGLFFPSTPST